MRSIPEVVGVFPTDVSVYGVRDVAGSARSWCRPVDDELDPEGFPIRGGAWSTNQLAARTFDRIRRVPEMVIAGVSFRMARSLPR